MLMFDWGKYFHMRCLIFVLQSFHHAVYLTCYWMNWISHAVLANQWEHKPCFWRFPEGGPVPAESSNSDMHVIYPFFFLHYYLNQSFCFSVDSYFSEQSALKFFTIDISGTGYSANIFIALCTVLVLLLHKSCDGKYSSGSRNMQFRGLFLWCSHKEQCNLWLKLFCSWLSSCIYSPLWKMWRLYHVTVTEQFKFRFFAASK